VHFHHVSGRMDGLPGTWGYVEGGMGRTSFLLCDIATRLGAVVAAGVPVKHVIPEEGVVLESGETIRSRAVVINADPRRALALLGEAAPTPWKKQIESVPIQGCTAKINLALKALPNFRARPGTNEALHLGQINTPLTKAEWKKNPDIARAGSLPERLWTELYFHTAHDASVAPKGVHTMSVFAQYVPTQFKTGTWETRREEVWDVALRSLQRFISNFPDAILHREVMGPPDIEKKVGLTGGHIFQGEITPAYMWHHRLTARTPLKGVYLCGAGTFPGGSVMGINGRNASKALLTDSHH